MRRVITLLLLATVGCVDDSAVADICRTDENCPVGQVCRESPIEPGRTICVASCVLDDECAAGESCSFGRCLPTLPTDDAGPMGDGGLADRAVEADATADASADATSDATPGDGGAGDEGFPPPDALLDLALPDESLPDGEPLVDLGAIDAEPIDMQAPSIDLDIARDGAP